MENRGKCGIIPVNFYVEEGDIMLDRSEFDKRGYLLEDYRMQGYGRVLTRHWEHLLKEMGYDTAMTSTQANEGAQHFYRHLGYSDIGGFLQPGEAYELILFKAL